MSTDELLAYIVLAVILVVLLNGVVVVPAVLLWRVARRERVTTRYKNIATLSFISAILLITLMIGVLGLRRSEAPLGPVAYIPTDILDELISAGDVAFAERNYVLATERFERALLTINLLASDYPEDAELHRTLRAELEVKHQLARIGIRIRQSKRNT